MKCPNCGYEVDENTKFCTNCGNPVMVSEPVQETAENDFPDDEIIEEAVKTEAVKPEVRKVELPLEYKPIGMWGYFGYQLLFGIPIIGFIFLVIFAFGGTKNVNLRNYSRAHFCWIIISFILAVVVTVLYFTGMIIPPRI